MLKSVAMIA